MKSLSVIVPVFNEEQSVEKLHKEIVSACSALGSSFEAIFVDDGSSDATLEKLKTLSPIKVVSLRRNFGQTAAFDAGIKASSGEVVVTLDGDGQNDPADIPKLIKKLDEGFDMAVGWRKDRKDALGKRIVSRSAHMLRRVFVRDGIHDSGSSLKAARRECFDAIELYGEMHRFIPGLLAARGYRIGEVVENHRPRLHGASKYTIGRTFRGFLDMLGIWFWRSYSARPLHLFGGIGISFIASGSALTATLFFLRLFHFIELERSVWPFAGFFLVLAGIQLLATGLLADVASKGYFQAKGKKPYSVREIIER